MDACVGGGETGSPMPVAVHGEDSGESTSPRWKNLRNPEIQHKL